jgi:hypothetical protein
MSAHDPAHVDASLVRAMMRALRHEEAEEDLDVMIAAESRLAELAQRNTIVVRLAQQLRDRLGSTGPLSLAAEREERRVASALSTIETISKRLNSAGVPFVLTKAFQHLPDMGHDIDVLVGADADTTLHALRTSLDLTETRGTVAHRFAGKREYTISGSPTSIEIHYGRLGHVGEHEPLASEALKTRERVARPGSDAWQLSPAVQVLLSVLQRLYGHMTFRVSDVLAGERLINQPSLDWNYIERQAALAGITSGLHRFRAYCAGDVHALAVEDGVYAVPRGAVVAPLFAGTFFTLAGAGRWRQAGRIALIPPIAAASRLLGI